MKKLIALLSLVLVITGCSSKESTSFITKVSSGDETIANIAGEDVTKQTLYKQLIDALGANKVVEKALQDIATIVITDQEAIDAKVQENVDKYENMFQDETQLNEFLKNQGVSSMDELKEKQFIPNAKVTLLIEKYINDNFSTLSDEYAYSYIQTFSLDSGSDAADLITKINNGDITFEDAAKENTGSEVEGELCYIDNTSLDKNIVAKAKEFVQSGIYGTPITTTDGRYAIVKIVDVDREAHKDEIVKSLTQNQKVSQQAQAYYLNEYKFEVDEPSLKKRIQAYNEYLFKK